METTLTKYNEESDNNVPSHQAEKVAPSTHKFNCPRCGHGTDLKANMTSHLSNKKECKVLFQDISRDVILNTLNSPPKLPQMECPKCNKVIAKVNIARHNKTCKENTQATSFEHTLQSVFTTVTDLDNYIMAKVQECVARQVGMNQICNSNMNINVYNRQFEQDKNGYIYLLQSGEDRESNIYKIGRTSQSIDTRTLERLKNYPRNTIVYYICAVSHCQVVQIEENIKKFFVTKYELARGQEWFKGNLYDMKKDIDSIIDKYQNAK